MWKSGPRWTAGATFERGQLAKVFDYHQRKSDAGELEGAPRGTRQAAARLPCACRVCPRVEPSRCFMTQQYIVSCSEGDQEPRGAC